MKIIPITDTHFGYKYTQNKENEGDKWLEIMSNYMDDFFLPLLRDNIEPGDIVVHMGDLYHDRGSIPINVFNKVQYYIEEICKIAPLHLLVGNHDLYKKNDNTINSSKPLKWIKNLYLYESPTQFEFNNRKILFLPWVQKKSDMLQVLADNSPCDYLFCHSDLNGCIMHLNSSAHRSHDKVELDSFKSFKYVYSGHIHIYQKHKNFTFVGSPYEMDRSDMNTKKGIFILDTNTGKESFIENNVSPKYKKIEIIKEEDFTKLDGLENSIDFIDLSISNSLIMSSKKIRRRIDEITSYIRFESVHYINDILKETKKDEYQTELISEQIKEILDTRSSTILLPDGTSKIKTQTDVFVDIINLYIDNNEYESKSKEKMKNVINRISDLHNTKQNLE